jgi:galactose mutarotase-like enzyme
MTTPDRFTLRRGLAVAEVALAGGELLRWGDHGRELLWHAEARWWPRSCPVLFPIVGRLHAGRTRIDGVAHEIGIHGFAATADFELRERSADALTVGLASNATTRRIYPFEFDLAVSYRLLEAGLEVALSVRNCGHRSMPFALGLHPGFRWPFSAPSADAHAVVFEHAEAPEVPVITAGGLLASTHRSVPLHGRRLALSQGLFHREALCFLGARSRSVRFEAPDGAAIQVSASGFSHWALWSRPGAPFLCIEAWSGQPDPEGFDGELADKPSMRQLAPGASAEHRVNFAFEPARGN